MLNQSEEIGYIALSPPILLYIDWDLFFVDRLSLRAGLTMTRSVMNFNAYKTDWRFILTAQNIHMGYKFSRESDEIEQYLLIGLAYVNSDLQTNKAAYPSRNDAVIYQDSGFGIWGGAGFKRFFNNFEIGVQLNLLTRDARFNQIINSTGHINLLITGGYRF